MKSESMNNMLIGGITGESIINQILHQYGRKFYKNIYLKNAFDSICQIDFLVVSDNSLISIEVKNYQRCAIKGDVDSSYWTACYLDRNRSLYNPVKQNRKHIDILRDVVDVQPLQCFSFIVFTPDCKLFVKRDPNETTRIIYANELYYELCSVGSGEKQYNDKTRNKIIDTLDAFDTNMYNLSIEHQKYFNKKR